MLFGMVALVYGFSFLLVPPTVMPIYGFPQGPAEILLGRYFGAALVAIGLFTWLAREITDTKTHRTTVISLLISDIIG